MTDQPHPHRPHRQPRHLHLVEPEQPRLRRPSAPAGDVSVYDQDGTVIVLLRGTIDLGQAQELEEAGGYAIERDRPIMIDLRHVDLIDSVGISFLIRVAASVRAHGGTVTLCGPAPLVAEMLAVAGAGSLFTWIEGRRAPDGRATP